MKHLPLTLKEAEHRGWDELDVILVSADAYVDHPSFAVGIISRYIESLGLRIGIIAQPDYHSIDDFKKLGRPKYFFGVTAGNLDSMVSLYTAQRKIRREDRYSEEGQTKKRPYLPTIVYTNRIKEAYKGVPVIIGGIEASLRRIAHYDYYQDKIRPSILLDSKADLLVYGNGEKPLFEIISRLKQGEKFDSIHDVRGTVAPLSQKQENDSEKMINLPSFEEVKADRNKFLIMTRILLENLNPYNGRTLYQAANTRGIQINPPSFPLSSNELDKLYTLPYTYKAHPEYKKDIPALKVVESTITSHRGCYGGCHFCSIYMHQGKFIQSRTLRSILYEIEKLSKTKKQRLVINDLGGPTANMFGTFCNNHKARKKCKQRSCIYPVICKNLAISMKSYLSILEKVRNNPLVKNIFINTGIRTDLAIQDKYFLDQLARHYTSGRLSTAPEHCNDRILELMGKPSIQTYNEFIRQFKTASKKAGKKQYLYPYFIVGHPGADEATETQLANYIKSGRYSSEQVQEFYPTPMTISTAVYYTGKDPFTGKKINIQKKTSIKKLWKKRIGHNNVKNRKPENIIRQQLII